MHVHFGEKRAFEYICIKLLDVANFVFPWKTDRFSMDGAYDDGGNLI